jgi:AraC family transcriptional regulator, transcriptional activator FtrA
MPITQNTATNHDAIPPGPLVVALVYNGLCTFEFAIVAEIFGLARPEMGQGWYRFASAAIEPGPLRAHGGLTITCDGGLELLDAADLIVVPGWKGESVEVPVGLTERLREAHARGARLASICSGAFVLAATGLLSGQRAATHWRYAESFAQRHPEIEVDAEVLYVEANRVFTSAGSAAGIDLMLHIIRQEYGIAAANSVARRLVMPPHRNGGQAQFIERPVAQERIGKLSGLLDAIRTMPSRPWTVEEMAKHAAMSTRTFIRRFTETTGLPPGEWVTRLRVEEAKRLLEAAPMTIEDVARRAGFGSVETMRHHFRQQIGLSPREYRETFASYLRPSDA